jgi:hypothetical protein
MLFINQKYKPILTTQPVKMKEPDYNTDVIPSIQGQGINELIQKVKDMKIKELNKKRNMNSNNKVSFN